MIIINDEDTCKCGAYWTSSGTCCNGHLKEIICQNCNRGRFTKIHNDGIRECEICGCCDYDYELKGV